MPLENASAGVLSRTPTGTVKLDSRGQLVPAAVLCDHPKRPEM